MVRLPNVLAQPGTGDAGRTWRGGRLRVPRHAFAGRLPASVTRGARAGDRRALAGADRSSRAGPFADATTV